MFFHSIVFLKNGIILPITLSLNLFSLCSLILEVQTVAPGISENCTYLCPIRKSTLQQNSQFATEKHEFWLTEI
jgi:hypothetical protein